MKEGITTVAPQADEVPPVSAGHTSGIVKMFRKQDGRYNDVAPENVQDYLDSDLWAVVA